MKKLALLLTMAFISIQLQAQIVKFYKVSGGTETELKSNEVVTFNVDDNGDLDGNIKVVINYKAFKANYNYEVLTFGLEETATSPFHGDNYGFQRRLEETAFAKKNANLEFVTIYLFDPDTDSQTDYFIFKHNMGFNIFKEKAQYLNVFGRYIDKVTTKVDYGEVRQVYDYSIGDYFVPGIGVKINLNKAQIIENEYRSLFYSDELNQINQKLYDAARTVERMKLYPGSSITLYNNVAKAIYYVRNKKSSA